jgi:hypothetical protein
VRSLRSDGVLVNRQPGLKRLELRTELTYYLQVARTGEVVGGFDIVLKRVRDLDRKGEGQGAELIVGVRAGRRPLRQKLC